MASPEPNQAHIDVVAKGKLKRSADLLGLWGSVVGHSVLVSCDRCPRESVQIFMEYAKVDLCLQCVAALEDQVYPDISCHTFGEPSLS